MSDSSFPRPPARRIDSRIDDPRSRRVSVASDDGSSVSGSSVSESSVSGSSVDGTSNEGSSEASRSSERPLRRARNTVGEVVEFPRPVSQKRRRAESPAASLVLVDGPALDEAEPERPAYLASELLREDWFPYAPLQRTRRWSALILGAAGATGTIAFGGLSLEPLLLAAALACCAVVALFPLRAAHRGVTVALLGGSGLGYAAWTRFAHDPAAPLLTFGILLAASALLFRGAHRTSRLARVLVAVGLVTTAAWLALSGGLQALVVEQLVWQDAAGPAVRFLLGIALIASALTFLDPNGRGGAWIVAPILLACLGLEVLATLARAAWPLPGGPTLAPQAWVATFATPFLAALAAGGLCQIWVLVSRTSDAPRASSPPELAAQ